MNGWETNRLRAALIGQNGRDGMSAEPLCEPAGTHAKEHVLL